MDEMKLKNMRHSALNTKCILENIAATMANEVMTPEVLTYLQKKVYEAQSWNGKVVRGLRPKRNMNKGRK